MTTYTVTIARTVYETVNVEVTAENEAAAIEKAKRLVMGNLPWQEKPAIVVGLTSGD